MYRSLPKPLRIAGLVAIGVLALWFLSTQRSSRDGMPANVASASPPPAPVAAKPAKPAAMENPATYAAVRLKQIKADPKPWADAWQWRNEFAAADTPELKREVLGLARQVGATPLISILGLALASDDAFVRLDAARSISLLPEDRLRDGFAIGVEAADPEIRAEVMDLILQLQPHLRAEALKVALAAAAQDVQARAIEILSDQPNPAFFSALIEGLRTVSPEIRPLLDQAIMEIVNQQFASFDDGKLWWDQNRVNYDDLMSLIP
jgi:hypothetical protein